jgi:plasmid stabilization system protein ParE
VTYRLLSPAESDLAQAMDYYDRASPGLGLEFLNEVERTVQRILLNPEAWTKVSAHSRRCRTRRFPYGVFYSIHEGEVVISGVMDLRRHPDSWRTRIERS